MIRRMLKQKKERECWRRDNSHNYTKLKEVIGDKEKIHIGRYTYGDIHVSSPNTKYELFVGDFCSIAGNVWFMLGADHPIDLVSTYPFKSKILNNGIDAISKGNIVVDDDVWIGENAMILSGVHIGQGAVIAAGAVVNKDVPPYAVVGGVPAKILKYRFEEETRNYMIGLNFKALTVEMINEHAEELYKPINNLDLTELQNIYSWFPRKK